jgi:hypothetical protein
MNKDLSDKEIEDFSDLTKKVSAEICRISDAHNIDRDSALKYLADMLADFTEVAIIQNYDSKQTNADRIRSMTDDELALAIVCPAEYDLNFNKNEKCNGEMKRNCYECSLKWLQEEREE